MTPSEEQYDGFDRLPLQDLRNQYHDLTASLSDEAIALVEGAVAQTRNWQCPMMRSAHLIHRAIKRKEHPANWRR